MPIHIGRFHIPLDAIVAVPEAVRGLMGRCIILDCMMDIQRSVLQYVAICDEFRAVPDDDPIPVYIVIDEIRDHSQHRYFFQEADSPVRWPPTF